MKRALIESIFIYMDARQGRIEDQPKKGRRFPGEHDKKNDTGL